MTKKALITGIAGQDGSYLAELLLDKGYEVHGIVRRVAIEDTEHKLKNIVHLLDRIQLHVASLDNVFSVIKTVKDVVPEECYHLASSSFVSYSFEDEISILNNNVNSTHYLLAALKEFAPECRFYFAGTSEMFGQVSVFPQDEATPFTPRSIYGISKLAGYHLVRNYRQQYGAFACTGILYNHESPRRGYEFVTRKIVSSAVKISLGLQKTVLLGNLDACRDWGYAPDYVEAMWRMLQAPEPDDYVVATGVTHTVREFVSRAFAAVGLDYRCYVQVDPRFFRPTEAVPLCGAPKKIHDRLGWAPTKTLDEIIAGMVSHERTLHGRQEGSAGKIQGAG
ncbi:GDP-mannose 4,6-dehydratase [Geobacter pickeringii]|uniref:GDP-mannose 4,6-dehydratase n=1 Tax=Geobacter pickeringii TaxID=345632 RepID=A0A0B5BCE6_9BACT|nr:GDP-mannose 4,6-dehydratase [Geobacter pickeringii]AJE04187.1 GDP-D-mannose dehydratase [Geobacter pickeringii]